MVYSFWLHQPHGTAHLAWQMMEADNQAGSLLRSIKIVSLQTSIIFKGKSFEANRRFKGERSAHCSSVYGLLKALHMIRPRCKQQSVTHQQLQQHSEPSRPSGKGTLGLGCLLSRPFEHHQALLCHNASHNQPCCNLKPQRPAQYGIASTSYACWQSHQLHLKWIRHSVLGNSLMSWADLLHVDKFVPKAGPYALTS